jgi:acetyl esterase/lipase
MQTVPPRHSGPENPRTSAHDRDRTNTRRLGLGFFAIVVVALLAGCSATSALNGIVARDTYTGDVGLPYALEPRQRLDIFRPVNPAPGGKPPIVVFFYGGNWTRGDRAAYRFVGEALAANGVIALVADYRLSPSVRYPEFLRDCARATQWVFAHAAELGGDPSRIYLMGHSAGAYNAAMLALDPRWLKDVGLAPSQLAGWIGLAGPYDFLPISDPEVQVAFDWPGTPKDSQPIAHAATKAPRTLLIAGSDDKVVSPQRSTVQLGRLLANAGTDVQVQVIEGKGHATIAAALARPLNWLAPVLPAVLDFVQQPSASSAR